MRGRTVVREGVQAWAWGPARARRGRDVRGPLPAGARAANAYYVTARKVWDNKIEEDEHEVPDIEEGDIEEFRDRGVGDVHNAPERDPQEHLGWCWW